MRIEKEEKFIEWWEANRELQKKSFKQFIKGLSKGLAICVGIILILVTGWYKRANMEANSQMSITVFAFALLGIAVFMAWLYQNYQWEVHEQQYLELMAKKNRVNKPNELTKI